MKEIKRITKLNHTRIFNPPFTAALFGSTRSGKTTFLNHFIPKACKNYDLIFLFSNSEHSGAYDQLKGRCKNLISFGEFKPYVIDQLEYIQSQTSNAFQILIILDDEIDSKNMKQIKNLFCVLRNSNFSTIFSGQDYSLLNKVARNNLNYCFIFKQNTAQAYEDIYKIYLRGIIEDIFEFPTKMPKYQQTRTSIDFMKKATDNHNILFIDILDDYTLSIIDRSYLEY